jgi:hypothetical protein
MECHNGWLWNGPGYGAEYLDLHLCTIPRVAGWSYYCAAHKRKHSNQISMVIGPAGIEPATS